jgi:diphthamide synthase (EF-2-diphthine--ammonia ligase)
MQTATPCWSGGKDSARALYEVRHGRQYEVVSLLTTAHFYDLAPASATIPILSMIINS